VLQYVALCCSVLQCAVLCGYSELPILQSLEPTLARVLLSPVREKRRTERENKEGGDESEVKAERTSVRLTSKTQLCPADFRRHMQYAMQSDTGLAQGMYFVDSCCSKTFVKDVRHLKNITLMTTPAKVAGLTGITEIQHQGDLYMPIKDVKGKQTTIILKGVYFDPNIKYNLMSVNELANIDYESRFGQIKSSIQGSAGTAPLVHTSNVYALEVMEQRRTIA